MGIGEFGACPFNDARLSSLLWRNGPLKERTKHDDDVTYLNRNCQRPMGHLWIQISFWLRGELALVWIILALGSR